MVLMLYVAQTATVWILLRLAIPAGAAFSDVSTHASDISFNALSSHASLNSESDTGTGTETRGTGPPAAIHVPGSLQSPSSPSDGKEASSYESVEHLSGRDRKKLHESLIKPHQEKERYHLTQAIGRQSHSLRLGVLRARMQTKCIDLGWRQWGPSVTVFTRGDLRDHVFESLESDPRYNNIDRTVRERRIGEAEVARAFPGGSRVRDDHYTAQDYRRAVYDIAHQLAVELAPDLSPADRRRFEYQLKHGVRHAVLSNPMGIFRGPFLRHLQEAIALSALNAVYGSAWRRHVNHVYPGGATKGVKAEVTRQARIRMKRFDAHPAEEIERLEEDNKRPEYNKMVVHHGETIQSTVHWIVLNYVMHMRPDLTAGWKKLEHLDRIYLPPLPAWAKTSWKLEHEVTWQENHAPKPKT